MLPDQGLFIYLTEMLMADDVIHLVNDMGRSQCQPWVRNGNLKFE